VTKQSQYKRIKGGITAPLGYKQAALHCGIKKRKPDLALIISGSPAVSAGLFTTNSFKAAPVLLCKDYLKSKKHKAIIINSGNANCLTGKQGLGDAALITENVGSLLGCEKESILICSTGIIGKRLPVTKIKSSLQPLVLKLSRKVSGKAAEAIKTTDTFKKEVAYSFRAGKGQVRIAGIAKGAGMIEPNLATMLCVITTDAGLSKALLKRALKEAVCSSFNSITVDGDMSTNDTVLALANGLSGVDVGSSAALYKKFIGLLKVVCLDLAKMIVADGEGATKFIEIEVKGAKTRNEAKTIALNIANSNLFKTMCYGQDPNFGRVAAACGASCVKIRPEKVDIYLNGKAAVRAGTAVNKGSLKNIFKGQNIRIGVDLNIGKADAEIFTSDLSTEYVKINAAYS